MEVIMSNRPTIFPYRKGGPYANGHIPTYRRASCSVATCYRSISWADLTKGGAADSVVAEGMRKRNWFIDMENEKHICAQCRGLPVLKGPYPPTAKTPNAEAPTMFFKSKSKPTVTPSTYTTSTTYTPPPVKEDTPTSVSVTPTPVEAETNLAAPTPLELRRIRALLDNNYDLHGQRYRAGFTDATLAAVVGVPEHWVLIERELAYGPAESPESEAEAQVRMLNELVEQARHHAEEANAALQLVEEKVEAIKKLRPS